MGGRGDGGKNLRRQTSPRLPVRPSPRLNNPQSACAAKRHDGEVVVLGHSGAEVREVAEAFGDERAGQKRVVLAEEASQTLGGVLLAALVARLGEAVGEEEERVARLHSETFGGELLVAEDSDGQPGGIYESRAAAAQKERRAGSAAAEFPRAGRSGASADDRAGEEREEAAPAE